MSPESSTHTTSLAVDSQALAPDLVHVTLRGEADAGGAPALRQVLLDVVAAGNYQIVVDLTHVTYIDSSCLGVLIGAVRRVREHDGSILLISPNVRIQRLFSITGLCSAFESFDTLEELLQRRNRA